MSKKSNNESNCSDDLSSSSGVCKKESEQWKAQYLRANADFENFKRRIEKEQAQWYQHAQEHMLLNLLNVVDDFDRAFSEKQDQEPSEELEGWFEGFELIYKSLQKLLQQYDVHEIEQLTNFDPTLHEAVAQIDSPDHETGTIVEVIQKGYMFNDKVLRPAKVAVAQ